MLSPKVKAFAGMASILRKLARRAAVTGSRRAFMNILHYLA